MFQRRVLIPLFFILPTLLLLFLTMLYPLFYSFYISLHEINYAQQFQVKFVGLNNYLILFNDPLFIYSLGVTVYIVAVSIILQLLLGLMIALLLTQPFRGVGLLKTLSIVPWALPGTIIGGMFYWIFNSQYGLLNGILRLFNIIPKDAIILWLGSPLSAIHMIILVDVWRLAPFVGVMLAAGITTIPRELYESAIIDGANAIKRFLHITLPLIKPFIIAVLIIRTIFAFQIFDIIYVLTRGGPGTATYVTVMYIWNKSFNQLHMDQASAASFVLLVIILTCVLIYSALQRKGGKH